MENSPKSSNSEDVGPSPDSSITQKAVRSGAWIYGRGFVTNIINLGVIAILARQLTPADFGLVALAQVLLRFISILGAAGVGEYIIYDQKEGRDDRVQAAFWLNLALSLGVMGVAYLSLPLIGRFYTTAGLTAIMAALVVRFGLEQLATVPDALIKKSINFQKLAIRDTIIEIASSITSVIMALLGWGVWSLVIPGIVLAPVRFIAVLRMASWAPKLPLRINLWRVIFKFSANIIGANLATTIAAEGDTLIIGKTLGDYQLGLYNMAWQSANLVSRNVSGVVGKLAMPSLSAISSDPIRMRNAFHRMLRILAISSFPLIIGLFVIADMFILTVYGAQWQVSILPLQILLIYAIRQVVGSPASVIYNVVGKPEIGLKFTLGFIPFYLISILIGSRWGIVGVAIGVTVTRTLGGLVAFWIAAYLLHEPFGTLMRQFWSPLSAGLIMGGAVWISRLLLNGVSIPMLIKLGILIFIGGIIYVILLLTIYRKLLAEIINIIDVFYKPLGIFLRNKVPGLAGGV